MKKSTIISENIIQTLSKMIVAFQIRKKIGNGVEDLPSDPEIKQAFKDLRTTEDKILTLLKSFCARNPDHAKCKDKSENK